MGVLPIEGNWRELSRVRHSLICRQRSAIGRMRNLLIISIAGMCAGGNRAGGAALHMCEP